MGDLSGDWSCLVDLWNLAQGEVVDLYLFSLGGDGDCSCGWDCDVWVNDYFLEKKMKDQIPNQKEVAPVLLLALHKLGGSAHRRKVFEMVRELLHLPKEILEFKTEGTGWPIFEVNIGWARNDLKNRGFLKNDSPRGVWELSEKGKDIIPKLIFSDNVLDGLDELIDDNNEGKKEEARPFGVRMEEKIDDSDDAQLDLIRSIDPFKFERLCGKLFQAVGMENVKVTQKSNDGGIDGVGDLVLGLVKMRVAFQAKRFKKGSSVGSGDVQKLAGAKQQDGAEKAVFITTSHFSVAAKNSAKKLGVELIDGFDLLELLRKYKIGFSQVLMIDSDFFENL